MRQTIEKSLLKFLRKADPSYHSGKTSWAQQGEDMIIDFIFTWHLNCRTPSYLEIGANHPSILNNSYFFYKKGCRGVNIEPNPQLIELLRKVRPGDTNLNIGIGNKEDTLDFYVMSSPPLSTFSKEIAEEYTKSKQFDFPKIESIEKVKIKPVNEILEQYFKSETNYFITIDVEGMDYEVLSAIDFKKYRPAVICIETHNFDAEGVNKYSRLLKEANYKLYADTSINSIYINKERIVV